MIKNYKLVIAVLVLISYPVSSQQNTTTLNRLINEIHQGKINDNAENLKRENEFRQKRNQQEDLLADSESTKISEENRSTRLEAIFEEKERELNILQATLNETLVSHKEFLSVVQQLTVNTRASFENSVTNIQYPGRAAFLEALTNKIDSNSKLPSIDDIERLWFELQKEMTESGKVVKFTTDVIDIDGSTIQKNIIRIGNVSIIGDGSYLNYLPETGSLYNPIQQPEKFIDVTSEFFKAKNGKASLGIDLTGGSIMSCYFNTASYDDTFCKSLKKREEKKELIIKKEECDFLCQLGQTKK